MEKEIIYVNSENGKSKQSGENWYRVNYLRDGKLKTDYVSAIEFMEIGKKAKQFVPQTGIFSVNQYDRLYLSNIK